MNRYVPDTSAAFKMPPGKYWIGDLCYVQGGDLREAALDLICNADGLGLGAIQNGQFEANGVTFGEFSTLWGDGDYDYENKSNGATIISAPRSLGVDSGCIGIIPLHVVSGRADLGIVAEFPSEFECISEVNVFGRGDARHENAGKLMFGSIEVQTGDNADEDEDEEDT